MNKESLCYMICPSRGGSMERFLEKVKNIFTINFIGI